MAITRTTIDVNFVADSFNEADHPRKGGKFTSSGGGGGGSAPKKTNKVSVSTAGGDYTVQKNTRRADMREHLHVKNAKGEHVGGIEHGTKEHPGKGYTAQTHTGERGRSEHASLEEAVRAIHERSNKKPK